MSTKKLLSEFLSEDVECVDVNRSTKTLVVHKRPALRDQSDDARRKATARKKKQRSDIWKRDREREQARERISKESSDKRKTRLASQSARMRRCRARKAVENTFLRVASASERTSPIEGANKVVSYMVEEETTKNVLHSIFSEGTVTHA